MVKQFEINWDAVKEKSQRIAEQPARDESRGERPESIYFSMVEPGTYKFRVLPAGNYVTGVPWKVVVRHELPMISEGGKDYPVYVLCWHFIANEKKEIGRPLAEAGKLTKKETDKYRQFGCPICNVRKDFYQADSKAAADRLGPREKYFWNILSRSVKTLADGTKITDPKVYVWSCSKTVGEGLVSTLEEYRDAGRNILDLKKGSDYQITATGPNNLNRRYKNPMFAPIARPALKEGLAEIVPHDLTKVVMEQFKTFQETIDALHKSMGREMARKGIHASGDESNWSARPQEEDDDIFAEDDTVEVNESAEIEEFGEPAPPNRRSAKVIPMRKIAAEQPGIGPKKKRRREIGEGDRGVKVGKVRLMGRSLDEDEVEEDKIPF